MMFLPIFSAIALLILTKVANPLKEHFLQWCHTVQCYTSISELQSWNLRLDLLQIIVEDLPNVV